MSDELFINKQLKGTGVSSGITAGKVYLLDRETISIPKHYIKDALVEKEIHRFKHAIQTSVDELKSIQDSIPGR